MRQRGGIKESSLRALQEQNERLHQKLITQGMKSLSNALEPLKKTRTMGSIGCTEEKSEKLIKFPSRSGIQIKDLLALSLRSKLKGEDKLESPPEFLNNHLQVQKNPPPIEIPAHAANFLESEIPLSIDGTEDQINRRPLRPSNLKAVQGERGRFVGVNSLEYLNSQEQKATIIDVDYLSLKEGSPERSLKTDLTSEPKPLCIYSSKSYGKVPQPSPPSEKRNHRQNQQILIEEENEVDEESDEEMILNRKSLEIFSSHLEGFYEQKQDQAEKASLGRGIYFSLFQIWLKESSKAKKEAFRLIKNLDSSRKNIKALKFLEILRVSLQTQVLAKMTSKESVGHPDTLTRLGKYLKKRNNLGVDAQLCFQMLKSNHMQKKESLKRLAQALNLIIRKNLQKKTLSLFHQVKSQHAQNNLLFGLEKLFQTKVSWAFLTLARNRIAKRDKPSFFCEPFAKTIGNVFLPEKRFAFNRIALVMKVQSRIRAFLIHSNWRIKEKGLLTAWLRLKSLRSDFRELSQANFEMERLALDNISSLFRFKEKTNKLSGLQSLVLNVQATDAKIKKTKRLVAVVIKNGVLMRVKHCFDSWKSSTVFFSPEKIERFTDGDSSISGNLLNGVYLNKSKVPHLMLKHKKGLGDLVQTNKVLTRFFSILLDKTTVVTQTAFLTVHYFSIHNSCKSAVKENFFQKLMIFFRKKCQSNAGYSWGKLFANSERKAKQMDALDAILDLRDAVSGRLLSIYFFKKVQETRLSDLKLNLYQKSITILKEKLKKINHKNKFPAFEIMKRIWEIKKLERLPKSRTKGPKAPKKRLNPEEKARFINQGFTILISLIHGRLSLCVE